MKPTRRELNLARAVAQLGGYAQGWLFAEHLGRERGLRIRDYDSARASIFMTEAYEYLVGYTVALAEYSSAEDCTLLIMRALKGDRQAS